MRVVEKRQLLSAEEISRTLQRLAHEIVEKSGGTNDLAFVGVRRRGAPLADRLAKTILDFSKVQVPVGHALSRRSFYRGTPARRPFQRNRVFRG